MIDNETFNQYYKDSEDHVISLRDSLGSDEATIAQLKLDADQATSELEVAYWEYERALMDLGVTGSDMEYRRENGRFRLAKMTVCT